MVLESRPPWVFVDAGRLVVSAPRRHVLPCPWLGWVGLFVQMRTTDKEPPTPEHREWAAEGFPPMPRLSPGGLGAMAAALVNATPGPNHPLPK